MRRRRHKAHELSPNLTSLIDVTFLLIVFFVLVSKIIESENVELDLPAPPHPATMQPGTEQQVVINVIPAPDGSAAGYRVGEHTFAIDAPGLASLTSHLAGLYAGNPQMRVNLRADRATHYIFVQPVVEAISGAARQSGAAALKPQISLVVLKEN